MAKVRAVSTRILGKTMRDALGIRKGGKGAVRLPKILVVLTELSSIGGTSDSRL